MVKKESSAKVVGEIVAVGAGIAALSAAAYVMFGPDAKKNKKAVKSWAVKMKGEIIEKLEEAKEITEPVYQNIINTVHQKYENVKNIDKTELMDAIADLRKQWNNMSKDAKPKKKTKKSAKRA
ncbi:MAG: hypothetical protein PHS95_03015 [Candidatus Pacebacteria bacterium]|nr:hypothetical protein [Candidatus Paceibacterota bacterium]